MANLHNASAQWQNRPADERFWGIEDMLSAARTLRAESSEVDIPRSQLAAAVGPDGNEIGIYTDKGFTPATHYAFNTLAARANAPAEYLRRLPAELAVTCLNNGLRSLQSDSVALVRSNGSVNLRTITSTKYGRVWYDDTISAIQTQTAGTGWRVPPARPAVADARTRPATEDDILRPGVHGLSIKVGDPIAPAGAYLSDRDMFLFMVDESREVISLNGKSLFRGFFLANSEVRARFYSLTTFLYDSVCGNHIVWGAEGVTEFKVKHLGDDWKVNSRALHGGARFLSAYNNAGTGETAEILRLAASKEIGKDEAEVLDNVQDYVNRKRLLIPAKRLQEAQAIALMGNYGNPRTALAMVSGLTQIARDLPYSDERDTLNRQAGKIIDIVR